MFNADATEVKLVITFLLIFSLFAYWTAWNENSRYNLTRGIVQDNSFQINRYKNNTGDRVLFDDNYYSDKAPGTSFLGTSFYWIIDSSLEYDSDNDDVIRVEEDFFNTSVYSTRRDDLKTNLSRFAFILFLSAFLGSLTILLVYRICLYYTSDFVSIITAFILGISTIFFAHATVFFGVVTATFLSFLSFYILEKTRKEDLKNILYSVSGLIMGFSVVTEYYVVLIFFFILIHILLNLDKKVLSKFVIGFLIGLAPLILYNLSIFGDTFTTTFHNTDPDIFVDEKCLTNPELELCEDFKNIEDGELVLDESYDYSLPGSFNAKNLLVEGNVYLYLYLAMYRLPRVLFYPYRGLFFYSPVLLFFIPGILYMYTKGKKLSLEILILFMSFVFLHLLLMNWHAGASFGARYFVPILPFLMIPISFLIDRFKSNKIFCFVLVVFISVSTFHMFLGFNGLADEMGHMRVDDPELSEYFANYYSFKTLDNPLYNEYLPRFKSRGASSEFLNSLFEGSFDLTKRTYSGEVRNTYIGSLPFLGIIYFDLKFLSLILVSLVFIFVWFPDITNFLNIENGSKKLFVLVVLLLIPFLMGFRVSNTMYGDGWYYMENYNDNFYRPMKNSSTTYIYSTDNKTLNLDVRSYYGSDDLGIYLNNELIIERNVNDSYGIEEKIELETGINELKIYSGKDCIEPYTVQDTLDDRCISFIFEKNEIN